MLLVSPAVISLQLFLAMGKIVSGYRETSKSFSYIRLDLSIPFFPSPSVKVIGSEISHQQDIQTVPSPL